MRTRSHGEYVEKEVDQKVNDFYSSKRLKPILGNKEFIKRVSNKFIKDPLNKDISSRRQLISVQYPTFEEKLSYVVKQYDAKPDEILKNSTRGSIFERNLLIYLLMGLSQIKSF